MDEETKDHKLRLLAIYQENLRELELQAARFGQSPPLNIINEIKHHRKNIQDLQTQLELNAQEVPFDKLLLGIEDLQRFARQEAKRALEEYGQIFASQGMLGFGLLSPLCGGILVTMKLEQLYQQYLRGTSFIDQYHLVSAAIYILGFSLSGFLTYKLGEAITRSKYDHYVYRMGYDPRKQ
jgi:hypothetical protein